MMKRITGLLLALLLMAGAAQAGTAAPEAAELAANPAVEARLKDISRELRCLVCQNETLADSNAMLAQNLRREVRALIESGRDDAQVIAFLTERYGDYVLYDPPFKPLTWLLWLGPFALLALGGGVWWRVVSRRPGDAGEGVR